MKKILITTVSAAVLLSSAGSFAQDKYTIISVAKISSDNSAISTRIRYNKQDVIAPRLPSISMGEKIG